MAGVVNINRLSLLSVVAILTLVSAAAGHDCKKPNYYYDHGTGHCEHCRDICQYAEIQRTVEACKEQCPDYLLAIECTDDQYFDDIVRQCGPCSELCDHSERTGTTDECKEKCPAYLDKRPAQDQAASHQIVNDLKAVQTDDHQNDDDASTSALPIHPAYIAVICIGVLLLILVPVTVVIGLRQCTRSYERAPQDDVERQGKGGNKPVEETSQGSSDSQHFALGPCHPPLPQTGFSELDTSRQQ